MGSTAKQRHTDTLLKYLADPSNEWPTRAQMALEVIGFKNRQALNKLFTNDELLEIDAQGLAIRRTRYAGELAAVDRGILATAKAGDSSAAKLCYQKFEGWSEKKDLKVSGSIQLNHDLTPEAAEALENVYSKG